MLLYNAECPFPVSGENPVEEEEEEAEDEKSAPSTAVEKAEVKDITAILTAMVRAIARDKREASVDALRMMEA